MDANDARVLAKERHAEQRHSGELYDMHLTEAGAVPGAVTLKLADRIASVERGGPKRAMYRDKHPRYHGALHEPGEADAMWEHPDRKVDEPSAS